MARRSLPKNLHLLHGNPSKKDLSFTGLLPENKIPECPSHLNAIAKKEWKRISIELHNLCILTKLDHAALEAYCQEYARWTIAEKNIRVLGEVVKTPSGYPIQNPWISVANKALDFMHKFLSEFGMTPASRKGIDIKAKNEISDSEKFLFNDN